MNKYLVPNQLDTDRTLAGGMSNNNNVNNGTKIRLGSKECLMISILKLCVNLVQIPLQAQQASTTSQTDEHKAASTKLPCVTDMGESLFELALVPAPDSV